MFTAAVVLYPSALASSITMPMEVFQAASQMASARRRGEPQIRFLLTGFGSQPVQLVSGLELRPNLSLDELPAPDLLLLPAIWRNPLPTINAARPWLPRLREIASTGSSICSVGTASCLLAEAGMLTGKPATTHWNYFDRFAKRYPDVNLKTRHLITQSDNIYCVGSVNSVADLMVHIVEGWLGSRIARRVENQFSPEIRQPFRAAAYQDAPNGAHQDETVLEGQQWIQEHLDEPISIASLADHLKLNPRTLNRRFKKATGHGPQAYLQSQRLATARTLLRNSNLTVAEVAWQIGLQDVSYFSQLFRARTGMTPLHYRRAVRGKLFVPSTQLRAD